MTMKYISETNTYEGGVRRAVVVQEYTEEEDRRSLAQVQSQLAYQLERKREEGDPDRFRAISATIAALKDEEKRLLAAIAGYDA